MAPGTDLHVDLLAGGVLGHSPASTCRQDHHQEREQPERVLGDSSGHDARLPRMELR